MNDFRKTELWGENRSISPIWTSCNQKNITNAPLQNSSLLGIIEPCGNCCTLWRDWSVENGHEVARKKAL